MENKNEPRLTSRGMPIVTQGMIDAIWETYTTGNENWGQRLTDVQNRLVKEQPALVEFIDSQVAKYPPELHSIIFEVIVTTLTVLEDAAEANQLSSKYSKD